MKNKAIILSILLGSSLIAGAVLFLGYAIHQSSSAPVSDEAIAQGIERYLAKQHQQEQEARQREQELLEQQRESTPPVRKGEYVRGNPTAPITLIEYSDFECPYCKRFHDTAKELLENYPNKVNWVFRHLPLHFHDPLATQQAIAVECAGSLGASKAFWALSDRIFSTTRSGGKGMALEQLTTLATEIGLDTAAFTDCFSSKKFADKVRSDMQEAVSLGINGTPGGVLLHSTSGKVKAILGAIPYFQLEADLLSLFENE